MDMETDMEAEVETEANIETEEETEVTETTKMTTTKVDPQEMSHWQKVVLMVQVNVQEGRLAEEAM